MKEKLDFRNIVMPMCVFGCDQLYERGYLSVDEGVVVQIQGKRTTRAMAEVLDSLDGRPCSYWSDSTASYFRWHMRVHGQ